ncbi:MAG: polyribonucleotide nucleotidyltransferase [Planctomycetes bacterium]|nr:polyribonucleotide nucleotidyltransferase [Planctomycetota bacterium]
MFDTYKRVEATIAGRTIALETGHMARQAHGSVICSVGDSKVFAAVTCGGPRPEIDFFPLVVDYREQTQAAGKIPGGFFKREGRPTTKEILTMRLTDRAIRPLFAEGFRQEVQVMSFTMQYDGVNNTDVASMIASFAALAISGLPFEATMGATRIGHVGGKLVAFPSDEDLRGNSALNLVVAGHEEGIAMVEASAKELSEAEMIDALELAESVIREIIGLVKELKHAAGKPTISWDAPSVNTELKHRVYGYWDAVKAVIFTPGKHARDAAVKGVRDQVVADLTAGIADEKALSATVKDVKNFFHDLQGEVERQCILEGKRTDGRAHDEIRHITIDPDFVPRNHGSVLFTRGETQALVSCTLGTPDDEQIIDGIEVEYKKRFYLHYNFPPYSVGETRRIMGPGRREIGHGMLAERALEGVLPGKEHFPYTVRIVSNITESNGSSSMASVCGGCLSLMLAGVPISQPVAGIAMGLVEQDGKTVILSDIQGSEDHNGDMDFKVAGSGLGITALQMDIKIKSVSRDLLERALGQAAEGRRFILRKMLEVVSRPSAEISEHAPRFEALKIPGEKIGFLIGPGGKTIKGLQEQYGVRISVMDDDGHIQVFGTDSPKVKACAAAINAMCETPKIGSRYTGTVKSIRDFGAFIEILPGVEGLCHISELAEGFVDQVSDVIGMGEEIEVVVINVDDRGKVKLSAKQARERSETVSN